MIRAAVTITLAATLATPALAKSDHVYGPEPDWTRYKQLGEAAVRAKLPAGDWSVEWPNGYVRSSWRHKGRFEGYLTCARVRTPSPPKGFHPLTNFVVVIDQDEVKTVDLSSRESNSLVNIACEEFVRRGMLPPAGLMNAPKDLPASDLPARDLPVTSLGLTIRAMADGAYVVAVTPASAAEASGLKPGTVITRVNGIALAGLGAAMQPLLGSDMPTLTVDTAAGAQLQLRRQPR